MRNIEQFLDIMMQCRVKTLCVTTGLYEPEFTFCFYWQPERLQTRVTQTITFHDSEFKTLTREEAIAKIEHAKKMLREKLKLYREYESRIGELV